MKGPGASGPGGLERRRAPRTSVPGGLPAISVVGAELLDVSPYGMMIESPLPLELETVLRLRLVVAGEKADVEARVAACTLGPAGTRRRFAVGLEFTKIAPRTLARLTLALAPRGASPLPAPPRSGELGSGPLPRP